MVLGTTARAALATRVASRLQYRDFLMVSLTTFDGAVVSIGWFGRVIVLDDFADSR